MSCFRPSLAVLLSCLIASTAFGEANVFAKVRYNGGSVPSKVDPKDWDNELTVNQDQIVLDPKGPKNTVWKTEVLPKSVTSLSYGQEADRRVGTMIALAVLISPVALFGLLHKTRLHCIGIQYSVDGKNNGVLLQGDRDNYRPILVALQGVTGIPVSIGRRTAS